MPGSVFRRLTAPFLALALTSAVVAGCSGGSEDEEPSGAASSGTTGPSEDPSATPSDPESSATASAAPYLPVPAGVELTPQGSELAFAETAVVAWEPRQGMVGVLEVAVRQVERTTFEDSFVGWKLDEQTKASTPYFVRAKVHNVGRTDLGGLRVPLYIVDGRDTLVEYSRFASRFRPCPSEDFPKAFKPGDRLEVCLVYLAPDKGRLEAVSFRPTQEFDPITWTGEIEEPESEKARKGKGKAGRNGGSGGDGKG